MSKSEIKKNLRRLSGLLDEWGYVKNPRALYEVDVDQNGKEIQYELTNSQPLIFNHIDIEKHTIPYGLEKLPKDEIFKKLKLTFVCGENITGENITGENADPILNLVINIVIDIEFFDQKNLKEVRCCWHLDRHNYSKTNFPHPKYHLTFGGKKMKTHADSLGNLLLMPTPRIMYPPMEIVLSCDFIIRNFYHKEKKEAILEQPGYINLVENAKNKYWKPYACAFASKWIEDVEVENLTHNMLIGV